MGQHIAQEHNSDTNLMQISILEIVAGNADASYTEVMSFERFLS